MIETKLAGITFTDSTPKVREPYIIATFGEDFAGKTRFALTGPDVIGLVVLEMKSYPTIEKDAAEMGKRVFKPSNPADLLVPTRKVMSLTPIEQQQFYIEHVKKVKEITYQLLEHKEVKTVAIDKFNVLCAWMQFAINGMEEKYIKVQGEVYKDRRELNQSIIDFLNSLSQFGKTVILNNASTADYEVVGSDKKPIRKTYDSFKYLGSHVNVLVELAKNQMWDGKKKGDKFDWRYRLNVRKCQKRPELEGPDGNPLLEDDMISLGYLMSQIDPDRADEFI